MMQNASDKPLEESMHAAQSVGSSLWMYGCIGVGVISLIALMWWKGISLLVDGMMAAEDMWKNWQKKDRKEVAKAAAPEKTAEILSVPAKPAIKVIAPVFCPDSVLLVMKLGAEQVDVVEFTASPDLRSANGMRLDAVHPEAGHIRAIWGSVYKTAGDVRLCAVVNGEEVRSVSDNAYSTCNNYFSTGHTEMFPGFHVAVIEKPSASNLYQRWMKARHGGAAIHQKAPAATPSDAENVSVN